MEDLGDKLLAPEARVHAHEEDHVAVIQNLLAEGEGRGRVQHHACLHPGGVDGLEHPMDVCFRLHMEGHDIRPRVPKGIHPVPGSIHHEVHVQRQLRKGPQSLAHGGAEGQVGHEMTVHHVEMDPVRAASFQHLYIPTRVREVGGKDGGGDLNHTGVSS